jgi:hypothetical protein
MIFLYDDNGKTRLSLFKTLHKSKKWNCPMTSIYLACIRGDLPVLQFLTENRDDQWDANVMDLAAEYGHVHIVVFLAENRFDGCTDKALLSASKNGHLDVVKYLARIFSKNVLKKAMELTMCDSIKEFLSSNQAAEIIF